MVLTRHVGFENTSKLTLAKSSSYYFLHFVNNVVVVLSDQAQKEGVWVIVIGGILHLLLGGVEDHDITSRKEDNVKLEIL